MILALAVLIIMIALIMFDVMPFGAPPIFAWTLHSPGSFCRFCQFQRDYDCNIYGCAGRRSKNQAYG